MITSTKQNIRSAGISTWLVKAQGDEAYYDLGLLRDSSISIEVLAERDSRGRSISYAARIEASAKFLSTEHASVLAVLPALGSVPVHHRISAVNGLTLSSELGNAQQWGVRWRFVSDKDMDSARYLELTADRIVTLAELDALRATPPPLGTPDQGDYLYALGSLNRSAVRPAGISKIELREVSGAVWTDTLGYLRNGKFTAELRTATDQQGRSAGYAVAIELEAELLQSSASELERLAVIAAQGNDVRVTFADGLIATFDDSLGVQWEYRNEGTPADPAVVRFSGNGIIELAQFTALWS